MAGTPCKARATCLLAAHSLHLGSSLVGEWRRLVLPCCADESTTIYLKVTTVHEAPRVVSDHDVPIFTASRPACTPSQWDLTTQQVNAPFPSVGRL